MRRLTLAVVLAGCLSEPPRPHGDGPPIAAGSVLRAELAVGDLDGDGYDDIVAWGNESMRGQNPTLFVYWGGEQLENPDVRVDLTIDDPSASGTPVWFEVLTASISISSDGDRGVVVLTGQDTAPESRPVNPPRLVYTMYVPAGHRSLGAPTRSSARAEEIGGYTDLPAPVVALAHDPVQPPPLRELVAGDDTPWVFAGPPTSSSVGSATGYWDLDQFEMPHFMQHVFVLPPEGPSEDLLLITGGRAYRVVGTGPMFEMADGGVALAGSPNSNRTVRGAQLANHFYAVATDQFMAGQLAIVDVPPGADPVSYGMVVQSSITPTDATIGDADGNSTVDVVTIEGQALSVYEDLGLDPTMSTFKLVSPRMSVGDYDLIAVGNFQGDARREIYVLSSTNPSEPPMCFRVDGNALDPCNDE